MRDERDNDITMYSLAEVQAMYRQLTKGGGFGGQVPFTLAEVENDLTRRGRPAQSPQDKIDTLREEIIQGAARALWVQGYASLVEESGDRTLLRPGQGEDWMDHAPETHPDALAFAIKLIRKIEMLNDAVQIEELYRRAVVLIANGGTVYSHREPTPELFGHYLAMPSLGHGVAWSDDYPDHKLNLPLVEFYVERDDMDDHKLICQTSGLTDVEVE